MNKKINKGLLCLMFILIVPMFLTGCNWKFWEKKKPKDTSNDTIKIESTITFNSDLNGTQFPTNTFPISTDIYLYVKMNFQNQSKNDHTVAVEIYIDSFKLIEVEKTMGDSQPNVDHINNDEQIKFSGINIAIPANNEEESTYIFTIRSSKDCKSKVDLKFFNGANDSFKIFGGEKFATYNIEKPENSLELAPPVATLSNNKINLTQSLSHNGFMYTINKNGENIKPGGSWFIAPTPFIDFSDWEAGDYSIEIIAKGDGRKIQNENGESYCIYIDSKPIIFNFNILEKVDATLNKSTQTLSWKPVPHAIKYKIESELGTFETDKTNFVVDMENKFDVTFKITTIGDPNFQCIDSSIEYQIKKLVAPTIKILNHIYLIWENVPQNSQILIYIDDNYYKTISSSETKFLLPQSENGSTSIKIRITNEDIFTLYSEESNVLNYQLA